MLKKQAADVKNKDLDGRLNQLYVGEILVDESARVAVAKLNRMKSVSTSATFVARWK